MYRIEARLKKIEDQNHLFSQAFNLIIQQNKKILMDLTALSAAVAAEDTAIASAIALLNTIPGLIAQIPVTDPAQQAAVDALTSDITAKTASIVAALTADTPTTTTPAS